MICMIQWISRVGALLLAASPVSAQTYPTKQIRIVAPFAAGGGVDVVARTTARHLTAELGQPTVIENRAGASGNVGAELVLKAEKDGHTLMVSASTLVVDPGYRRRRRRSIRCTASRFWR